MSNREVYLDSLLQAVSNPGNTEKGDSPGSAGALELDSINPRMDRAAGDETLRQRSSASKPSRRKRTAKKAPEDDFLKSFEQEFLDVDSDSFLREFEESLGVHQEEEVTLEEAEDDFVDAIDDMMVDTLSGDNLLELALDGAGAGLQQTGVEAPKEPIKEPAPAPEPPAKEPEPAPMPEPAPSPELGMIFDDLDLTGVDFEVLGEEPKKEEPKEPETLEESIQMLEDDADAELIDLLAGMSGDSDIAQITDMLKAHDSDQQMFADEMTDLDLTGEGTGDELGFLDDLQAEGEKAGKEKKKREKKKKEKKPKEKKKGKKNTKQEKEAASDGFLSKLSGTLFGADDEEELTMGGSRTLDGINVENISEENRSILMEMDKEQEQKAKKKKEKKPKKEKPKKEKKPAKKKAPKPKKEKKEKKPKEKGEPIPVKPLILTIVLGVSIVVLVILGGNLLGYSSGIAAAEDAYNRGDYVEAYREIEGMDIKKGDQKFYDRVRTSAYVQKQLDFAEVYQSAGMYPEALDALCQALNRYDLFYGEAEEAGSAGELAGMYTTIETRLSEEFLVTVEEAREIFSCEERKEYTAGLRKLLERAGLPVE